MEAHDPKLPERDVAALGTTRLLADWHAGNEQALDQLLQRNLSWIRNLVRKRLGPKLRSKAETTDIVQDAIIRFMKYGPRIQLENEEHFRALLARIVINVIRDQSDWFSARRRDMAREVQGANDVVLNLDVGSATCLAAEAPSKALEDAERDQFIRLALELLSPDARKLVILRNWDGWSFAQLGTEFGISEAAADRRYRRAMQALAKVASRLGQGQMTTLIDCTTAK